MHTAHVDYISARRRMIESAVRSLEACPVHELVCEVKLGISAYFMLRFGCMLGISRQNYIAYRGIKYIYIVEEHTLCLTQDSCFSM